MPGGHSTFLVCCLIFLNQLFPKIFSLQGFLNTGVHIVMYTYYMLAAMGPQMQKYLWWKKYLTVLQMIQFVAVFFHAFQLLFYNPCNYSMAFVWVIILHAILFFYLFANFFSNAYKNVSLRFGFDSTY
jgi:phosphatidylglycerophosphate synthase